MRGKIELLTLRNNRSSLNEPSFVQKSIEDLLASVAVVECSEPPKVVNPLTVPKKGQKMRLVLDLRHVNEHLPKTKCKYDGHDTAMQFLTETVL